MKKIKLFSLFAAALFAGSTMAQTVTTGTYSKRTINGEGNTSTWDFTGINTSTESNLNVAEGADEDIYYKPSQAGKIKLYKGGTGLSCTNASSIYLPVPSGSAGTVTMTCFSSSSGRQFDLYVGDTKSDKNLLSSTQTNSSFSFVSTDITTFEGKTYLLLKDNNAEMKVSSFSIALTVGSYAAACTDAGLLLADNPDIEVNEGEELTAPALTNPNKVTVTYASSDKSVVTVAADGTLTSVGAGDAVITISSASQKVDGVLYCADELTYNVKIKSLSPVLEATESALDFSLNAFETTKSATFTVSGYNLTGEASVSTLPAGFTLDPTALTITDGAVEQAFTLTYTAEAAVEASNANLVFTVGETSVTIALTYGKKAALSQTIVTDSTTWDWSKASATAEIKLTDTSIPSKKDTILLANVDGYVNDANFNSQALLVCGEYLIRDSKYFQGGYISFHAERKGFVTVNYSNTGDNAARSLVVNGTKDAAVSSADSKTVKTSSKMSVNAGKVVITFAKTEDANNAPQYARVYSITYTVDKSGDIGSAFDQTQVETKAVKVIRDGQLLIIREGKTYTAQGVQVQ